MLIAVTPSPHLFLFEAWDSTMAGLKGRKSTTRKHHLLFKHYNDNNKQRPTRPNMQITTGKY